MGELSVARLQALLAGETDVPQVTVVPTELRVRGSQLTRTLEKYRMPRVRGREFCPSCKNEEERI